MNRFAVLVSSVFLCGASQLAAQDRDTSGSFSDVIDVEVVDLEVYVTDGDGHAVAGLGREDFELQVDGEGVEVANFYAVREGRRFDGPLPALEEESRTPRVAPVKSAEPVFLVVFLDNVHLSQFTRNRVLEELRPFLKDQMTAGRQVMLATFDGQVKLRGDFTRDWKDVRSTLDELASDPGFGHRREREHSEVIQSLLSISDMYADLPERTGVRTRCPREVGEMAHDHAQQVYSRVRSTAASLGDFVDTLGSLPGRKALLHVSDGIPLFPGAEVYEYLCMLCGSCASDIPDSGTTASDVAGRDQLRSLTQGVLNGGNFYDGRSAQIDAIRNGTSGLFRELTRKANRHRVTFFTFEAYGPRSFASASAAGDSRTTSASVERVRIGSLQDTLFDMAEQTGGRAILDTTDFGPSFAKIVEDLTTYYSLGYHLPRSAEGRDLSVKVKVRRPGTRVRYRRSLHTKPLSEQLADRTRGALMYGLDDNPLGLALEIGQPEPLDKSLHMVPIRVRIPLDQITLLPESGGHRGQVTLYLAARDRTGRLAPVRTQEIPIRIPRDGLEAAREESYVFEVKMLMRQGDHTVAVGLHDDLGRLASYLTETVLVFPQ